MYFDEVIDNRRSARLFTNDVVSENQLTKILLSNILAPSARNRQPWKFYILNTLQKNDIMNMLFNWVTLNPNERTSVKGTAKQIRTADKMVISLQAINLGLGSCILCDTLYIEDEINQYLGIKNFEQICGFIIGNPIYSYPPEDEGRRRVGACRIAVAAFRLRR